jgi:hypothetical protein
MSVNPDCAPNQKVYAKGLVAYGIPWHEVNDALVMAEQTGI